jgi:signal transduction histidine kinase
MMAEPQHKALEQAEGRFRLLRKLALDAASGMELKALLKTALEQSLALYGVEAGSVSLLGDSGAVEWSVVVGQKDCAAHLGGLEKAVLGDLRAVHKVRSLYMTIDQDGPAGVFSYPLQAGGVIYGAVSGLARGERNLAAEEEFISATAAVMALAAERHLRAEAPVSKEDVAKKARAKAITETAVAINHQINNPLTAISGNLQILLSRAEKLPPEVIRMLKKIEEGADRILAVTDKLRNLTADKTIPYIGDTTMIDLDATTDPDEDEKKK